MFQCSLKFQCAPFHSLVFRSAVLSFAFRDPWRCFCQWKSLFFFSFDGVLCVCARSHCWMSGRIIKTESYLCVYTEDGHNNFARQLISRKSLSWYHAKRFVWCRDNIFATFFHGKRHFSIGLTNVVPSSITSSPSQINFECHFARDKKRIRTHTLNVDDSNKNMSKPTRAKTKQQQQQHGHKKQAMRQFKRK